MRHGILASVALLTLICLAVGDEPKRLDAIDREPDEGRVERALLEQDRTNLDPEINELKAKLEHLRKEERRANEAGAKQEVVEVREKIADIERHLDKLQAERKRRLEERPTDELDEPGQRIEHIRIAAKHLEAAGMHGLAHDLMERAEAMEREDGQVKERRSNQQDDLRREVDKVKSQNEELRQKMKQLQHEVNELRDLMSKE